jgi:hypothetical protein
MASLIKPQVPSPLTIEHGKDWPAIWKGFDYVIGYLQSGLIFYLQQYLSKVQQAVIAPVIVDVVANQTPFGNKGALFYAIDTNHLYLDIGTAWQLLI